MAAVTNKILIIIACVLALIGWAVSLGGVAALNDQCNDATNNHSFCSRSLRYSWWGVWYCFFFMIVVLIMAVLGKTEAWTSTLQAFCAALLSVTMIDATDWHGVSGNGNNDDAVNAALAGFIIISIGVALLIIFLGMGSAGVSVNMTVSKGSNKTTPAEDPKHAESAAKSPA